MQVDPIKPTLKAPGTKRLKLKYDEPLSKFAFKFNLRRYSLVQHEVSGAVYALKMLGRRAVVESGQDAGPGRTVPPPCHRMPVNSRDHGQSHVSDVPGV